MGLGEGVLVQDRKGASLLLAAFTLSPHRVAQANCATKIAGP